ncbi:MAG: hypothetical protein ACYCW6_00750 [Candidatus Xenobia bacterium]
MFDELKSMQDQMRSDFEAVMLGFATQRGIIERQGRIIARLLARQGRELVKQGEAIGKLRDDFDRWVAAVQTHYEDHERRIQALEAKSPAA